MTDLTPEVETAEPRTRKPKTPEGHVRVRVLPMGHRKVFTGAENMNSLDNRFPTYGRGEEFTLEESIAQTQENAGLVEILP